MTEKVIKGKDAEAFLNSPNVYKDAINALELSLDAQILGCDPDNKEKASRLIISKQLLNGIVREISRFVEDGQVEAFQLHELEQRKRPEFKR